MVSRLVTERVPLSTNFAVAYAVKACDVDVVAAYPITPQAPVAERIAQFVADGEMTGEYIAVESEHSALSACIGASATGARTFTATCSQGLALMHECLFIASGSRLPVVMGVSNRTLSAPINIHCDHQDTMASRDCGWIQLYVSSAQEAYDSTIQGFRLAELEDVLLPVMVCFDGYTLSHTSEAVVLNSDEDVRGFVPRKTRKFTLNPDNPVTIGVFCMPEYEYEFKYQVIDALAKVPSLFRMVDEEFGEHFGRSYGLYEAYRVEDADVVMVAMGTVASTAKVVVDELRQKGLKVGVFRPRLFRPNPVEEWREILLNARALAVVDRAISFGGTAGPLMLELLGVFMNESERPMFTNYVAGIGGRDVTMDDLRYMFNKTLEVYREKRGPRVCEYYGVRW